MAPPTTGSQLIADSFAASPVDLEGQANLTVNGDIWTMSVASPLVTGGLKSARFFPYGHEINHSAAQPVSTGPEGLQIDLTPTNDAPPEALEGIVVFETASGAGQAVKVSAGQGDLLPGTGGSRPMSDAGGPNILVLLGP